MDFAVTHAGFEPRSVGLTEIQRIQLLCFQRRNVWLPGMDSNHDSRLQRPLSYH
jgi:hypothetical protein